MNALKDAFFEYASFIIFLPLVLAFYRYRAATLPAVRVISWYLVLSSLAQVSSFVLWKHKINNFPILHIYTVFEFCVLMAFFSQLFEDILSRSKFIWAALLFILLCILDSFLLDSIYEYNIYSLTIEALVIITLCVFWFVYFVSLAEEKRLMYVGVNYFIIGLLIYFAGSITLFAYSSYVDGMNLLLRKNIWTFHTFLATQLYVLIFISLWKTRPR